MAEALSHRRREAARLLGVSERTLWAWTAPRGPIPATYVGTGKRRVVLYGVDALRSFLANTAAQEGDHAE